MLFNSLAFALFLPIVFGIYWQLGKHSKGLQRQNLFLLGASYFFYAWWDARFLALIIISSLADYLLARQMERQNSKAERKPLLWLSLSINLGLLGFFKYFNFFIESFVGAFAQIGVHVESPMLNILLPVGISFYTFQTLSYTIDVYRGKMEAARDPVAFFAYVGFFPQLVAGPIEKARDLLPQFSVPRKFSYPLAVSGLRLILYGIIKKVVISDRLAEYVNLVYAPESTFEGLDVLLGILFFAFQIYCDFSGYSDIAIGTARLFGFQLSINFRTPFFSQSVSELWRRWHITLNAWFRDYVYQPLGGRSGSKIRTYINVLIVFLVSGFWHGAAWTYIVWGAICALFYTLEALLGLGGKTYTGLQRWLFTLYTFGTFAFGMVFFRAPSVEVAWEKLGSLSSIFIQEITLFSHSGTELSQFLSPAQAGIYLSLLLLLFLIFEFKIGLESLDAVLDKWPRPARWLFYYGLIALLLIFGAYGIPQQFIYFQF